MAQTLTLFDTVVIDASADLSGVTIAVDTQLAKNIQSTESSVLHLFIHAVTGAPNIIITPEVRRLLPDDSTQKFFGIPNIDSQPTFAAITIPITGIVADQVFTIDLWTLGRIDGFKLNPSTVTLLDGSNKFTLSAWVDFATFVKTSRSV